MLKWGISDTALSIIDKDSCSGRVCSSTTSVHVCVSVCLLVYRFEVTLIVFEHTTHNKIDLIINVFLQGHFQCNGLHSQSTNL